MERPVTIRSCRYGIDIQLSQDMDFDVLAGIVAQKFRDSAKFFRGARMALSFSGRILTRAQEEEILTIISDNTDIDILCIISCDEKMELTYRSIAEQAQLDIEKRDGLFYRGTLAKRQVLESETGIVILGDVETGAKVIAKGNIVIVGTLYGLAHAGASGDRNAFVAALSMQPKKLCIADIEAKRQLICQESLTIKGPQIAVVDGKRIYLDPLFDEASGCLRTYQGV